MTAVRMGNLVGLSRVSRGDRYNPDLGIVIAAMKMRSIDHMDDREKNILHNGDGTFHLRGMINLNPLQVSELITAMLGYQHACHIMWARRVFFAKTSASAAAKLRGHKVIPAGVLAEAAGCKLLRKWRKLGFDGQLV
jgi:hypothetical protein